MRAGDRVPDARDRAGVGEGQHIFAVGVVAGDLHDRRFDVGIVQVADRDRVGDLGGRIVLGVGDVVPSIVDSTGASLLGVTSMSRVSVLESTSPSLTVKLTVRVKPDGSSLVFW